MTVIHTPRTVHVGLQVYSFLARRGRPKSYLGKIMLVAFIGTHIPLLALLVFALNTTTLAGDTRTRVLLIALLSTLSGTGATLYILRKLLMPVTLTFRGLRRYLDRNEIPLLPTEFSDEVGILMADTMHTITKLDGLIHHLRDFDALTGLPNRAYFHDTLTNELSASVGGNRALAVIQLDIDDFSAINNSLGSEKGDALLKIVSSRLRPTVRGNGVLARTGSDEFAVLQFHDLSSESVYEQAQRMRAVFAQPFIAKGEPVYLTASVGIAMYHPTADVPLPISAEQILSNADVALRDTRREGRGGLRFFAPAMNEALHRRLDMERELHDALVRNQLHLFYQLQIDSRTGQFIGSEALLRWKHPTLGWIQPSEFIHVAERTGLIVPIGEWVLRSACADNARWHDAGYPTLCVSVNLSPRQFQDANLTQTVRSILRDTRHAPTLLDLEITEGVLMEDVERSAVILRDLKKLGVTLSLDDFGTGYSSLNYLKRLPLDRLKIDQSFVRGIPTDRHDIAITQSIIALAQCLEIEPLAEGVETREQADYLSRNGCPKLQGFFFAQPMPADELIRFLDAAAANKTQPYAAITH
jgi:diguanylate cyclase (GGDEF)-like protein